MRNLLIAGLLIATPAAAQDIHAVKPLDGYACMNVTLPPVKLSFDQLPKARLDPSTSAPYGATVGTIVIAKAPLHVVNGYAEILQFDGREAWLPMKLLAPFSSAGNRRGHCTPSVMSDGKPGIS